MGQSPPGSLLRLGEADVVRACGLLAAAQGLEIVTQQAVLNGSRSVGRLEAQIVGDNSTHQVWAEASGSGSISIRWYCACRNITGVSSAPPLACEHVAALLTAWIRDPSSFDSLSTGAEPPAVSATPSDDVPTNRATAEAGFPKIARRPDLGPYAPSDPSLAEELSRLSATDLLAISRRVLGDAPQDAPGARKLLEDTLRTPAKLAALTGRLDQNAQLLLAELLLLDGRATSADLDDMAARAEQARGTMRIAIGVLERHALVFPAPGLAPPAPIMERGGHPWRQVTGWRIPREIRLAWSVPLPIPPAPVLSPKGPPVLEEGEPNASERYHPPRQTGRVTRASLRQLYLAFSLLAYAPARFNPNLPASGVTLPGPKPLPGPVPRPKQAAYSPPFPLVPGDLSAKDATDFARGAGIPAGLALLARRVLLLGREQGIANRLPDLIHLPSAQQAQLLKQAFVTWCQAELPLELADMTLPSSPVRGRFDQRQESLRPAALAAEVVGGRRFLLSVLGRAEPGTWYSLGSLLELIWRLNPFFLRGRQNTFRAPAWWLERTNQPRPLRASHRSEWLQAEGNYIRAWLCGPLHWWGALDLATNGSGAPAAVRLTKLGAYLLQEEAPGAEDRGPVWDHEDLAGLSATPRGTEATVVVTRSSHLAVSPLSSVAAGASLLDALATWARPVGIAGGRVIYTLDPRLALAALDQGKTADTLLSLLGADPTIAGQRARALVEAQVAEWRAAYGRTSITSGWTLVEARDEATLCEALAHLPDTGALLRRLSPTHALVAPELSGALEAELRKLGIPAPN